MPSLAALQAGGPKHTPALPPPVHEWTSVTGCALTDEQYQRAFDRARRHFKVWFRRKHPNKTVGEDRARVRLKQVLPFWCHVVADYALYSRVGPELRPDTWPRNATEFARYHTISLTEFTHLLHRVSWKRYIEWLYPPVPKAILLDLVDQKLLKVVLNDKLIEKNVREWKGCAELFYKRHGALKTGGGIQITNTNAQATPELGSGGTDEQELMRALKVVAPYLPKEVTAQFETIQKEVPLLAETEEDSGAEADIPARQGQEGPPES